MKDFQRIHESNDRGHPMEEGEPAQDQIRPDSTSARPVWTGRDGSLEEKEEENSDNDEITRTDKSDREIIYLKRGRMVGQEFYQEFRYLSIILLLLVFMQLPWLCFGNPEVHGYICQNDKINQEYDISDDKSCKQHKSEHIVKCQAKVYHAPKLHTKIPIRACQTSITEWKSHFYFFGAKTHFTKIKSGVPSSEQNCRNWFKTHESNQFGL
uniref:uncharacterized protein LOC120344697 isoform X1 n=1 Tax=Styela clava TaxID=7725 RepID=UPI001939BFC2|nr:uncharacterized protein LOC120344697 isoform X1 [Styela clava]